MNSNLWPTCFSLSSTGLTGIYCHPWLVSITLSVFPSLLTSLCSLLPVCVCCTCMNMKVRDVILWILSTFFVKTGSLIDLELTQAAQASRLVGPSNHLVFTSLVLGLSVNHHTWHILCQGWDLNSDSQTCVASTL